MKLANEAIVIGFPRFRLKLPQPLEIWRNLEQRHYCLCSVSVTTTLSQLSFITLYVVIVNATREPVAFELCC